MAGQTADPGSIPGYLIANMVLNSSVVVSLIALCVFSFWPQPSANNPTRAAFVWFKVALPLFIISHVLSISAHGYIFPTITAVASFQAEYGIYEAATRLDDASWLLEAFGRIAFATCLAEMALGIRLLLRTTAHDGGGTSPSPSSAPTPQPDRLIRYLAAAVAAGSWVVAVAYLALQSRYVTEFYDHFARNGDYAWWTVAGGGLEQMLVSRRFQGVFDAVQWLMAAFVAGLAGVVLVSAKRSGWRLGRVPTLHLAACLVWLLPNTWHLAHQAAWLLREDYDPRAVPLYVDVLKPALGSLPILASLLLVYVVGREMAGGLWAGQREWREKEALSDSASAASS